MGALRGVGGEKEDGGGYRECRLLIKKETYTVHDRVFSPPLYKYRLFGDRRHPYVLGSVKGETRWSLRATTCHQTLPGLGLGRVRQEGVGVSYFIGIRIYVTRKFVVDVC